MDIRAQYGHEHAFPRMTVGVMGSAGGNIPDDVMERVRTFGAQVARRGYVLVTGAAPGIPHAAVLGAKYAGGFVVGVSPALNFRQHVEEYHSPTRGYDVLVYTGSGLMGREIENIRTCDVVVFAAGRSGTLGEFAIAYDESKVIGILADSGGISDHIEEIVRIVNKTTGARVIKETDPSQLLDKLEEAYRDFVLPDYLQALDGHHPDGQLEP